MWKVIFYITEMLIQREDKQTKGIFRKKLKNCVAVMTGRDKTG